MFVALSQLIIRMLMDPIWVWQLDTTKNAMPTHLLCLWWPQHYKFPVIQLYTLPTANKSVIEVVEVIVRVTGSEKNAIRLSVFEPAVSQWENNILPPSPCVISTFNWNSKRSVTNPLRNIQQTNKKFDQVSGGV